MPPPEYVVLSQQIIGLMLAFASVSAFTHLRHADPTKRWLAWAAFVLAAVLWCVVVFWLVSQAHIQSTERKWVQARTEWLNAQTEKLVSEAGDIRYPMLTV